MTADEIKLAHAVSGIVDMYTTLDLVPNDYYFDIEKLRGLMRIIPKYNMADVVVIELSHVAAMFFDNNDNKSGMRVSLLLAKELKRISNIG